MQDNLEKFRVSINLGYHRLNKEKVNFIKKYLRGLAFINERFSSYDKFSKEILNEYYIKFLNEDIYNTGFVFKEHKENKNIEFICKKKIRHFKFTYFLYGFILDCLFINSIEDVKKGKKIVEYIKRFVPKRLHNEIDILVRNLYLNKKIVNKYESHKSQLDIWKINKDFLESKTIRVLVTANMSAGKSTLINSIIGLNIANTRNESCTSNINYYYNKSFDDKRILFYDSEKNLKVVRYSEIDKIRNNYENVYLYMKMNNQDNSKITIIDTPGVNSSIDKEHRLITESIVKSNQYEKIIYVINATNIGSDDDYIHLSNVFKNLNNKEIIFVLNKLDMFRMKDDSIEESINNLKKQLESIGYKNPIVCPISAYASGLFKKLLFSKLENEDEEDECEIQLRKFSRENFDLSKYYKDKCDAYFDKTEINFRDYNYDDIITCLKRTGIINLQYEIMKGND